MSRPASRAPYIYFILALIGWMVADLTILTYRDRLVQTTPPPARPSESRLPETKSIAAYSPIESRNIFNLDGKIPPRIGADTSQPNVIDEGPPVKSAVPGLVLVGTLVHSHPGKSVASVKTSSSGESVNAYRVGEMLETAGEVLAIERGKVIFRNATSQRKEFVELPQEGRLALGLSGPTTKQVGEVMVVNEFERQIKKEDVTRLTSNLPEVLQQARAVPFGKGFKIIDIMPGSIYERLGLKPGDVINSVNGEPVDSPQKAMQLYNELKNAANISLGIERNGRPETMNFQVQ